MVSVELSGENKWEDLSSCLFYCYAQKKQLGVAGGPSVKPYFIMVYGGLFKEPQVIRSSPHCHYLGTYCFKKKNKSHVKQVDWWVPYKTPRDTHVVRGEQEKRWTEIHY